MYQNSVQLKGFLGADASLNFTGSGKAVTNLSVATKSLSGSGENRKSYTEWHKVVIWGERAQAAADLKKGTYVSVQGQLRSSEYEGKNGKVRTYEIVANKIELPERPVRNQPAPEPANETPAPADAEPAPATAPEATQPADAPKPRRKRTRKS